MSAEWFQLIVTKVSVRDKSTDFHYKDAYKFAGFELALSSEWSQGLSNKSLSSVASPVLSMLILTQRQ